MPTGKHYFIEQTADGDFAVRAQHAKRASARLATQAQAYNKALELNPDDRPNIERVRHTKRGRPDLWR